MSSEKIQFIVTVDGSHTIYLPDLDETYHSRHGAITESQYVFIDKGLNFLLRDQEEISILEIGFGTGLNAFLSFLWSKEKNIKTKYTTLEPFPLPEEIYMQLNYPSELKSKEHDEVFKSMHSTTSELEIFSEFHFKKRILKLEEFSSEEKYDVIFYDAFAPSKQKDIWALENLKKCYGLLKSGGVLATYCANGQFKRDLKEAGFLVEVLPGPPGKKEMTRGLKS